MTGWESRYEGVHPRRRPAEQVDPTEAALVARLAAAGWTVADKRAGDDVTVTINSPEYGVFAGMTFRGPTTVAALTEACEEVGA